MKNIKLVLEYDGGRYKGWQRLGDTDMTVQAQVELALGRVLGSPLEILGAGRTDAGVHALGQVANFHSDTALSLVELGKKLDEQLPFDIRLVGTPVEVPERFHARFQAKSKTYLYKIWNRPEKPVFHRYQCFAPRAWLHMDLLGEAARGFLGEHDFQAFTPARSKNKTTVRHLQSLDIQEEGPWLYLRFTADSFLHNMVRSLVGTLLEVGQKERSVQEALDFLQPEKGTSGPKRLRPGLLAPPQGLYLESVRY